jgi:hypothetical protein
MERLIIYSWHLDKYTIVALPEQGALQTLNEIRRYLYTNDYRYSNQPPVNDVHITLAQAEIAEGNLEVLQESLKAKLETLPSFEISYAYVTDKVHPANEKYPQGSAWISLYFEDPQLQALARLIDSHLLAERISTTKEYVAELGLDPNEDLYSKIADHLNLCNYARVEKAAEAKKYVEDNAPRNFRINTVALRDSTGKVIWKFGL